MLLKGDQRNDFSGRCRVRAEFTSVRQQSDAVMQRREHSNWKYHRHCLRPAPRCEPNQRVRRLRPSLHLSLPSLLSRLSQSSATSMVTSTASPTSTVSPGTSVSTSATTATGSPGVAAFLGRRQDPGTTTTVDLSTATSSATPTSTSGSAGASATVSANPITLDTGSVYTEIGNISIFVGHVNVSIGNGACAYSTLSHRSADVLSYTSVKIKNVTLGAF